MRLWVLLVFCIGTACQQNRPQEEDAKVLFTIRLSEGYASAFKTTGGQYAVATVDSRTRFAIRFRNVPLGVRLRLPVEVKSSISQARIYSSELEHSSGWVRLENGSGVAVYDVFDTDNLLIEHFTVTGEVHLPSGKRVPLRPRELTPERY